MKKSSKLDELLSTYQTIENDIKYLDEKKKEVRKEIDKQLDSRARTREETWVFPGSLTSEEVEEALPGLVSDQAEWKIYLAEDKDWRVHISFPRSEENIELVTDRYQVKRTAFTRGDAFDFDRFKNLAPEASDNFVKAKTVTEYSLDQKKFNKLLDENPDLLSILRRCTVRGKPQTRLTIKQREEE